MAEGSMAPSRRGLTCRRAMHCSVQSKMDMSGRRSNAAVAYLLGCRANVLSRLCADGSCFCKLVPMRLCCCCILLISPLSYLSIKRCWLTRTPGQHVEHQGLLLSQYLTYVVQTGMIAKSPCITAHLLMTGAVLVLRGWGLA